MTRFRKSFIFLGIGIAVFFLIRFLLYLKYRDTFSALSSIEVIMSFVRGVRFDLSILLTLFALPLLFFNLPISFAEKLWWQKLWGWLMFALILAMLFLLAGDLIYFEQVKRHITSELFVIGNDTGFLLDMTVRSYKWYLVLFLLLSSLLWFLWRKTLGGKIIKCTHKYIKYIIFAGFLVLGIRGGISGKPINIIDAFSTGNTAYSNLVLNGAFTLYHHARGSRHVNHKFFPSEEAIRIAKTPLDDPENETFMLHSNTKDNENPPISPPLEKGGKRGFERGFSSETRKLNIVLMVLESWSPFYIDSFGNNGFGVTSNFDSLARDGLRFTRFYAVGQRSIEGIQASLTGIPPIIGIPNIGFGLEAVNFPKIGNTLGEHGYETIFIQTSKRRSFRMDAVARATGFQHYFGMEDIPMLLDYDNQTSTFGWDYEGMQFLKKQLESAKKPFFAFLFTGTTHVPYINPKNGLEKYHHDQNGENGFLNTLNYSDWSLGRFMEESSKMPWFDDTVFVFIADHNFDAYRNFGYPEMYHIPLLIYAPKIIQPGTSETIGSQIDIGPTILDILDIDDRFDSAGTSLFREKDEYAYFSDRNSIGIVTRNGHLIHSLKNRLEAAPSGDKTYLDKLERKLLALDQVMYDMITGGKFGI